MKTAANEWTIQFSEDELRDLESALEVFKRSGLALTEVTAKSFPLPTLDNKLEALKQEVLNGRGFVLLRGFSVEGRPMEDIVAIYLGIIARFGSPRPQNKKGDLLGHVRDLGGDPANPDVRIYQTNYRQTFHTDSADIVSLLCLKQAKKGGASSLVSSHTIFNEIMRTRPDLVPTLFESFPTDRRGDIPENMLPYFLMPIYHWYEGYLSAIYSRTYILSSQRLPNAPRLTNAQMEALELVHSLADNPDLHLNMEFEPGDIQILHNHQLLHDRTAFVDWSEPERKRHLLRVWLCPPVARPLPEVFAQRYGSTKIGDRGGIFLPNSEIAIRLN